MALTTQQTVQNLIDRANKLGDPMLAADIRAFAQQREFGLVFEHNRPERMRLYGRKVGKGDVVQVLPPRGEKEDASSQLLWLVSNINDDVADLIPYSSISYNENGEDPIVVELSELVAIAEYDEPIYAGLHETGRVERGGDKPYQVVINGENFHALEALTFAYAGKVDCIYIDPPYNTGAKDWKYNNDYVDGSDTYRHSKWLAMMERRLKIAKQLMNPEKSLLIVAIDEKEYLRLGLLLEQIFPEAVIQTISVVINPKGRATNYFTRTDEFLFYVFLGASEVTPATITEGVTEVRWPYLKRSDSDSIRGSRPRQFYPIYINDTTRKIDSVGDPLPFDVDRHSVSSKPGCTTVFPVNADDTEMEWGLSVEALLHLNAQGFVKVGTKRASNPMPYSISYLSTADAKRVEEGVLFIEGERSDGTKIVVSREGKSSRAATCWNEPSHDAGAYGKTILKALVPYNNFNYPKSLYAVEDALRHILKKNKNALIIDFFSGSGTTAHAVMRLNHQDGGNRQCICVTNNELSEPEEKRLTKQSFRKGDPEWESIGICEYITKPRIKAAITGLTPDGEPIKGDYKFIDEFPMSDGFEENAIFFDLTYQNPLLVEYGAAFHEIAPLLWLRAGSTGTIIEEESDNFAFADTYGILFNYAYVEEFMDAVREHEGIRCLYVITDDATRYANVAKEFPDIDVFRLYESYLQSFKIAAEGCE